MCSSHMNTCCRLISKCYFGLKITFYSACHSVGWRVGRKYGGGERERTVVSIFSSSRGPLRLTHSCFYKTGAEKPEQRCDFHQRPLWGLWWRACDTPDGFNRLAPRLAASWKPGRRRQSAVSQHHAESSEGCRRDLRSGLRLPTWCRCCDAGGDVFIASVWRCWDSGC